MAYANIDINVLKLLVEIYPEGSHMQSYSEHKTYHGHGKGDTLLHCAALYTTTDSETISFFVKKYPQALQEQSNQGNFPLQDATIGQSSLESPRTMRSESATAATAGSKLNVAIVLFYVTLPARNSIRETLD